MPKDNEAPVEVIQGEARALLEEFILCDDGGPGLYDCRDNHGVAYQSAHMAELLERTRHRLAYQSEAPAQGEGDEPEELAWAWIDGQYLNVEAGHDPNDRAYSADEMADAFIAGLATRAKPAPSLPLADREAIAREVLASALQEGGEVTDAQLVRNGDEHAVLVDGPIALAAILALSGSLPPSPVGEGSK